LPLFMYPGTSRPRSLLLGLGPDAPAAPTRGGSDRPRRAAITEGQNKSTRHKRNSENQYIPRRTANHHRDVCSVPTRRRCTHFVNGFLDALTTKWRVRAQVPPDRGLTAKFKMSTYVVGPAKCNKLIKLVRFEGLTGRTSLPPLPKERTPLVATYVLN